MTKTQPIQAYFAKTILQYAGLGLFLLCLVSLGVSLLLAREQMATDLKESAVATAQAFHDRILDGDIRSVEPQIRQILKIQEGESAQILNHDLTRLLYNSLSNLEKVRACPQVGETCFDGYFGQAHILVPVSLSKEEGRTDRYLYLSKKFHLNWGYLSTVFLVFVLGYLGLLVSFLRVSKITSAKLGTEILNWSERIKLDPKRAAPSEAPPFSELLPLRESLEGLNAQIENFEKTATDKARLLLLRGIAHDILSPLARLQRYLGVLEDSVDGNQHANTFSEMQDALKLVTTVASQVKTLNDLDAPLEETELVSATRQEIKAIGDSNLFGSKTIHLEFHSDLAEITSPFSRSEVSRIMSNLVQNAGDASASGDIVRVEIGLDGNQAFLRVKDQGCGIPEHARNRVFDPDFTLKPGTGTGLGLAIVKYICERRSAQIQLQTEVNTGTTVTIRLPEIGGTHV